MITVQSPEDRIADLEDVLRAIMGVHVLTETTTASGKHRYYISTGGCDVSITPSQYLLLANLMNEPPSENAFADALIELINAPLEDRSPPPSFTEEETELGLAEYKVDDMEYPTRWGF